MEATTPAKPRPGTELELEIDSLAQGGRGVARADGYVVFVSGALPGDRVRVRLTKTKKSFAEGKAVELLRPSSERIADTCVHDGEPCPGAPWQGMSYERQLAEKAEQAADALRRIGRLEGFDFEPIVAAVEPWRYRNKTEYSFGERDGEATLGFHRRGSWSEIVNVDDCKLASAANNAARNAVRDWAQEEGVATYDSGPQTGTLRNLVVREGRRTGQVQTRLVTSPEQIPRPPVDLHTVIEGTAGGTDGPTGVLGAEHLTERVGGLQFRVSHTAFMQTNTEMAERLYEIVADAAALTGTQRVFDLFCGIGTIGLALADKAGEVWGLESVEEAVADAEQNAAINGIENARFVCSDARLGIAPLLVEAGTPDVVVVDPPRPGLSKKIVRRLLECEAPRIVYVSCNPTTLAPNAAQLVEAGYTLRSVTPVDMFPQTPHVECVAVLER